MVHCIYFGSQVTLFKQIIFLSLNIVFVLNVANSADPDEMSHTMRHFICVFTVCQSTCCGVTGPQRLITYMDYSQNFDTMMM